MEVSPEYMDPTLRSICKTENDKEVGIVKTVCAGYSSATGPLHCLFPLSGKTLAQIPSGLISPPSSSHMSIISVLLFRSTPPQLLLSLLGHTHKSPHSALFLPWCSSLFIILTMFLHFMSIAYFPQWNISSTRAGISV